MSESDSSGAPGAEPGKVSESSALLDAAIALMLFLLAPVLAAAFLGEPAKQATPDLELAAKVENGSLILLPGMLLMIAYGWWRWRDLAAPFRPLPAIGSYLVFAVVWIPFAMMLFPYLVHLAKYKFEAQEPVLYYALPEHDNGIWRVLLVSCVLAPIAEEVFFRGFLFRAVENATSPIVALFVTSALFASVHSPSVMIPVGFLGLFFGYLRLKTGGVGASILLHFVHNGWTVGGLLLFPQWVTLVYDK
jgi:membrane protease YdiL (CAAX protease family)